MTTSAARLPFLILLVLALIVPYAVVEHTYPIPTFYAELTAYTLYILLAASLGLVIHSQRHAPQSQIGDTGSFSALQGATRLSMPRIAGLPLALCAWLLAQMVLLQLHQPLMNLLGAGFLLAATMAVFTGYWARELGQTGAVVRCAAFALVAGGAAAVLCQWVQLSGQEARFAPLVLSYGGKTARRLYGNMAQANHLATYLSFAMVSALYLVQARRLPVLVWLVLSIAYATGEALTVSRTPLVQTAMVIGVGWLMAWVRQRESRRYATSLQPSGLAGQSALRAWLLPLLLAVIYVAVNVAVRWANTRYQLQLADSAAARFEDAGQISPRLSLWRYGLAMFKSHPLTGVGWGEFPFNQFELAVQLGKVEVANNAHNIVIDLLAKTGLIGLGIVVLGLLAWLWRVVRVPLTLERLFALAVIGLVCVHAMVEYPQQYMFFLMPVAFMLGLLETRAAPGLRPALAMSAYVALVVAGVISIMPVLRDYQRSEVLYYGKAPETEYRAAPATLFTSWGQYGLATLLTMDNANLRYKLAMHEQAISLLPGDTVLKRYAVLLVLAGHEQQALDVVARLHVFASAGDGWPGDLRTLLQLSDEQGGALKSFSSKVRALYGEPASAPAKSDDDDDDDDDD